MRRIDLSGKKFGRLKVIEYAFTKKGRAFWHCICKCNTKCIKGGSDIMSGHTQSCGCQVRENFNNFKHGHARWRAESKFYRIWARILRRCRNKNAKDYQFYGNKGITCCKRWYKFEKFKEDMFSSYNEHKEKVKYDKQLKTTIDRIDNSLGYFKENCRWATIAEQARNRTNNINVEYKGEKMCLKDFSHEVGWTYTKTYYWYRRDKLDSFFKITFV